MILVSRELSSSLADTDGVAQIVDKLLDFNERNLLLDDLAEVLQMLNPRRFG